MKNQKLRFIDLFSGLGGFRIGFEKACKKKNLLSECVLSSEIKKHAISTYKLNFKNYKNFGDITKVKDNEIPYFDVLLAGFPCQSFSSAGAKRGFYDTRGTLFFEIARILKAKKPKGFILENVEGLVKHDLEKNDDQIGKTLKIILKTLKNLGYNVTWNLLNSKNFGVPQDRNRIFIVGCRNNKTIDLNGFNIKKSTFKNIQENINNIKTSKFKELLLKKYQPKELYGKAIKDKRGGSSNIHSWDLEIKGKISRSQKKLMTELLKQRRRKDWAKKKGIDWMDGMPLTVDEIHTFFGNKTLFEKGISKNFLKKMLFDLAKKGYLSFEHPKKRIKIKTKDGHYFKRVDDKQLEKGFNIVVGKLSFEISKIIDPMGLTPTLLATDMERLGIVDRGKIRSLSIGECKKLFGFSGSYQINLNSSKSYNLFGESIVIPVVKSVSERLIEAII